MAIFRGILGIIIGTAAAYLVGILLDYFDVYKGEDFARVYPFLTALGGAISGIIAMLIRGPGGTSRVVVERAQKVNSREDAMGRLVNTLGPSPSKGKSPASPPASPAATAASPANDIKLGESRDVPGMPSFELGDKNAQGGSRPKGTQQ
jgi:hypothetical protein